MTDDTNDGDQRHRFAGVPQRGAEVTLYFRASDEAGTKRVRSTVTEVDLDPDDDCVAAILVADPTHAATDISVTFDAVGGGGVEATDAEVMYYLGDLVGIEADPADVTAVPLPDAAEAGA